MSAGVVEARIFRAVWRALGPERASNVLAEVARVRGSSEWPEDEKLALAIVRGELFDVTVAATDRDTADALVAEIESALVAPARERRGRRTTPRVPTPAAPRTSDPESSIPPASGPRLKPHLQLLVVTRDFAQVSLLARLLPHGRALLVTKLGAFSEHLCRPGVLSVVVFDARTPAVEATTLAEHLAKESVPVVTVVWGVELLSSTALDVLAAASTQLRGAPASASPMALLRICLDVIGGGAPSATGSTR